MVAEQQVDSGALDGDFCSFSTAKTRFSLLDHSKQLGQLDLNSKKSKTSTNKSQSINATPSVLGSESKHQFLISSTCGRRRGFLGL